MKYQFTVKVKRTIVLEVVCSSLEIMQKKIDIWLKSESSEIWKVKEGYEVSIKPIIEKK